MSQLIHVRMRRFSDSSVVSILQRLKGLTTVVARTTTVLSTVVESPVVDFESYSKALEIILLLTPNPFSHLRLRNTSFKLRLSIFGSYLHKTWIANQEIDGLKCF